MSEELGLQNKKKSFSEWYLEVVEKAQLIDNRYGIKGFLVYLPLGMTAIKEITRLFEEELEHKKHQPVLFPVVIPESYLRKESEHIKGFSGEVFWITHAGKNPLEEKMCLRPTSETAMYPLFSLWIRSYQNLPLKIYQSTTVYRYESKMTKPLMRGREFYWIEAHTAQTDWDSAEKQTREDEEIFAKVAIEFLGIPHAFLKRPEWDKFPGADNSYAFETVLPDGKLLQIGTTHNLGEKFAKVFEMKYMDEKGKKRFVSTTSFGMGISRILAALVSLHGDDKGLIFHPAIAPIQIVIVPIYTKETKSKVLEKCGELLGSLEKEFRVFLDDREQYTPGFKFHEWELKGIPLRIELGPKDIEEEKVTLVRRDFLQRNTIDEDKLREHILETLDSIGFQLKKRAKEIFVVHDADDYKDLKQKIERGGFIRISFCMQESCGKRLKEETKAEVRGSIIGDKLKVKGKCAICGNKAKEVVYVGKAY